MAVFLNNLPFLLSIVVTYLAKEIGLLKNEDKATITRIAFNIVIPALIIKLLIENSIGLPDVKYIFVGIIIWSLLLVTGYFISKIYSKTVRKEVFIAFMGLACGPIIYPLVMLNYSTKVFSHLVIADITNFLLLMTFSYGSIVYMGKNKNPNLAQTLKKIILSPIVISIILGVLLSLININTKVAVNILAFFANSFTFLAGILLGLTINLKKIEEYKTVLTVATFKIVAGLIIGLLTVKLMGISGKTAEVLIMASTAPVPLTVLIFAEIEKIPTKLLGQLVPFTILLSIITLPILVMLLN
jgi:malate permease and related proteins